MVAYVMYCNIKVNLIEAMSCVYMTLRRHNIFVQIVVQYNIMQHNIIQCQRRSERKKNALPLPAHENSQEEII